MRLLTIILMGLMAGTAAAEQSPFMRAAAPYSKQAWLWEPVSNPLPASVGIRHEELGPQGRSLIWERDGRALFELQKGQWLRLYAGNTQTQDVVPAIWSSRGNGLFTNIDLQKGVSPGEWIVPPLNNSAQYLLIENTGAGPAQWWVSSMRLDRRSDQYPYRDRVDSETDESHWSFEKPRGRHLKLQSLAAAEHHVIELEGPGNWRMEVSFSLDPRQGWQRFIDLPLQLNGKPWKDFRLHPRTDHSSTSHNGLCEVPYSYPESIYISLPAGPHKLAFTAPQALSVRVLEMDEGSFALRRNQARPFMADIQELIGGKSAPVARFPYDE